MRARLWVKLCTAFVALAVLAVGVCGVMVDRVVGNQGRTQTEARLRYEVIMTGQMTASSLFAPLAPGDTSLQGPISDLAKAVSTHLSLLTPEGLLVADSEHAGQLGVDEKKSPEVAQAIAHHWGVSVRAIAGQARLWVAESIVREGHVLGVARASLPMASIASQVQAVRKEVMLAAALALLIASALAAGLSVGIARPVRRLVEAAKRIGSGALETRTHLASHDEIGELGRALDDMAGKLQVMVTSLDNRNRDMRVVLDNVAEGLLTLSLDGAISNERSAILERWFGPIEPSQRFWLYLKAQDPYAAEQFEMQWDQLVSGFLPLELCLEQLPSRCESAGRFYEFHYTPVLESGALNKVLILISDVTSEVQAMRKQEEQREILVIFERVMRDREGFIEFLSEADGLVKTICGADRPEPDVLKRLLHTLKGNTAIFGVTSVAQLCHELEGTLTDGATDLQPADRERLALCFKQFETRLRQLLGERGASNIEVADDEYEGLLQALLEGTPRAELAGMITQWKHERVQLRFERFAGQARALAQRLDKGDVEVLIDGDRMRLRRDVMAPFWTAFIHVIRNAADHGLVKPSEREGRAGKLRLSARHRGEHVRIEMSDDGRGIDWPAVARRAAEQGLANQTHEDLVSALFSDGLSTRTEVTTMSGRGAGLAAVREACEALGGKVDVSSSGNGTTFIFDFPMNRVNAVSLRPLVAALSMPARKLVSSGPAS